MRESLREDYCYERWQGSARRFTVQSGKQSDSLVDRVDKRLESLCICSRHGDGILSVGLKDPACV